MSRFLGIDFSGNHLMWRPGCGRSNVWISKVRRTTEGLTLVDLKPVQGLPGDQHPFGRLIALLREGDFEATAIDAPFSVPRKFISSDYPVFLERIGSVADPGGRPFPRAEAFVDAVSGVCPPLNPQKPLRDTEKYWREKGLNVRSTLWAGARGGAAMTAACLTLLLGAQRPIWPWVREERGLLVEAFPMAQLKQWQLPNKGYGKQNQHGRAMRERILEGIRGRIELGEFENQLASNADALDSVLCAFSAIAVRTTNVAVAAGGSAILEGWIAVHA